MSEVLRLILMLALAGAALTLLCSGVIWYMDEERRIRRGLRRVLGAEPEAVVAARGRGRGAGFSFSTGLAAVAWDHGAWCLVYRIDELVGAELQVNGVVVARAFRGEPRRALDQVVETADQVTLRLIFDDPKDPDFELDLWLRGDEGRRAGASPAKAVQEANRWMARAEAILRRPLPPRAAPNVVAAPAPAPAPLPPTPIEAAIAAAPAPAVRAVDDAPPWVEDDDDQDAPAVDDEEDWPDLPKRLS